MSWPEAFVKLGEALVVLVLIVALLTDPAEVIRAWRRRI